VKRGDAGQNVLAQGVMIALFLMLMWTEGLRYAIRPLPELASRRAPGVRRLRGGVRLDLLSMNLLTPAPVVVALTTPAPVPAAAGRRAFTFWTIHLEDGERLIYARSL
jgi:hypothetical protein